MKNNYVTCKKVVFYSSLDEDMFFDWIENIGCIAKYEGAGDELYLDLFDRELDYHDIKNLIALFYRYSINMEQLQPFITEQNKAAAEPWKKEIYKKQHKKRKE